MPRLTLRTLLAYMDDTLEPTEARSLGKKVAESEEAKQLVERIKKVTRRRGLSTPVATDADDETADPNTVAEYLDNALDSATLRQVEETCLESDVHLAEVAACHQILTLVLTEPVRVPPHAHRRMYQLVPPPASIPKRKPSKILPISGAPPAPEQTEADDADAALLLGMKRYSATNTWAARFALFGAAAVLFVLLAAAVLLSLPHQSPAPPELSPGNSYVLFTPPPLFPVEPAPKPKEKEPEVAPKPKDKEPVVVVPPMPDPRVVDPADIKPVDPGPGLGDPIPPPNNQSREIAVIKTNRVLVVTQPEAGGQWLRLKVKADDLEPVPSNAAVMALPGYKAELVIDKKVQLRLWGNVPEQLPYRVLESRVKIHSPPPEFDADITLLGGRIYIQSEKPAGAKVRLRLGTEVWDVTLPDADTKVLAELISWYEPGTIYARKEGSHPKLEGRVAVVFGNAAFVAPARFKKFDKMTKGQQVAWDSGTGTLSEPRQIPADQEEALLNPTPTDPLKGELNRNVARLLTNMADRVMTREGVHAVVKNLVGPDLPDTVAAADRDLVARLAIYSHAALADSTEAGAASLTPLIDVLRSELPWLARQAVVTALVNWVARDRGNTALLHAVLVEKRLSADDADWLLKLLRGYVAPKNPDPGRLDELVTPIPPRDRSLLGDPEVAIREAALWNIMVVRLESWVPLPLGVNVGAVGAKVDSDDYKRFLADGKKWVEEVKKRQPPPPPKKP